MTSTHRYWLIACMACVVMMVFIGGVTRLTESGLSIVEWKLISGTLPPLSDSAWEKEFSDYQTSPEFTKKNAHFTLADFKKIYWLEYLHRLMGRITGLVFLLPLIVFWMRRLAPPALLRRMLFITVLVGLQGTVGWVMVASGLEHQPRVSPIKLAMHLTLAFSVFGLLVYTYLQHSGAAVLDKPRPNLRRLIKLCLLLFAIQLIMGAIVAGLDAGLSYNSFPLMDGRWIPSGLHLLSPWWLNHLENIATVQFQHRLMALILVKVVLLAAWYIFTRHPEGRAWAYGLLIVVLCQFTLGVLTLLSHVNIWLASAHQLLALVLLACILRVFYASGAITSRAH